MPRVTAFLYGDSLSIVDSRTDRIDIPAGSGTVSLYLSTFDIFNADKSASPTASKASTKTGFICRKV